MVSDNDLKFVHLGELIRFERLMPGIVCTGMISKYHRARIPFPYTLVRNADLKL